REQDSKTFVIDGNHVVIEGEAIARDDRHLAENKVGVKFRGELKVLAEGGRVHTENDRVVVESANAVTLLFAAATSFRANDLASSCAQYFARSGKPYNQLRAAHIADHQQLFRRVQLNLTVPVSDLPGKDQKPIPSLPTDQRLKRVQEGATDVNL